MVLEMFAGFSCRLGECVKGFLVGEYVYRYSKKVLQSMFIGQKL